MEINPDLDVDALAGELARDRRLQIRDIFATETAEQIHGMLAAETPWWLAYNVGEKVEQLSPQMLSLMPPAQIEQILGEVVERAQTQYQFVYAFYPIIGNYFSPDPKPPITQLFRFLNTPRVLDWLRRLTRARGREVGRCAGDALPVGAFPEVAFGQGQHERHGRPPMCSTSRSCGSATGAVTSSSSTRITTSSSRFGRSSTR